MNEKIKKIKNGYQKTFELSEDFSENRLMNVEKFIYEQAIYLKQINQEHSIYLLYGTNISVRKNWIDEDRARNYHIEIVAETEEKISQIEKILFPEVEVKQNK